ncbi:MAG: thioesterase [Bacilli bacterium]|nr:thioesterase [Bacilli bacterium]MDY6430858.1 thioesterase [Bacilli bacterium]
MVYEENYFIDSNDVNPDLTLKIPSLFKILQDLGMRGSTYNGYGKEATIDKGLLWVYTRMEVKIEKLPSYLSNVKGVTYPGPIFGCFFPRHYQILDEEGNVLIKASSINVLMDAKNRTVCFNPPIIGKDGISKEGELPRPGKVVIDDDHILGVHKVKFSEIDLNGHLNNTRYIETILNLKDSSFYSTHEITRILINYDKEIKENEEIVLKGNIDNDIKVQGFVNEMSCFKAIIETKTR